MAETRDFLLEIGCEEMPSAPLNHAVVQLGELVRKCFDLRPASIIRTLDLRRPIYQQVAAYGHIGRSELDLPWEKLDRDEQLQKNA